MIKLYAADAKKISKYFFHSPYEHLCDEIQTITIRICLRAIQTKKHKTSITIILLCMYTVYVRMISKFYFQNIFKYIVLILVYILLHKIFLFHSNFFCFSQIVHWTQFTTHAVCTYYDIVNLRMSLRPCNIILYVVCIKS